MKKIIVFLITLIVVSFINIKPTYAASPFYQGEQIPNIYINKYNPNDNLIYYHPARIIRQHRTNNIAYCLEPFTDLNDTDSYQETQRPTTYNETQTEYLTLIAHFGYGYENHTDSKWYAITQMLIWKITNPTSRYYYTSTPNGEKITFTNEEQEIYDLVENYRKNTSFNNNTYTIVSNNRFTKTDLNRVLSSYKSTDPSIEIYDNLIQTPILKTGKYEIVLEKESIKHNQPILFYQSETNQDVITLGDPPKRYNKFTINVIDTKLIINKLDYDTNSSIPSGNAKIKGTILSLYRNNSFIKDIEIDETGTITLNNLNFGSYYLKEKTPGQGYTLNTNKYNFTLDENNPQKTINIKNKTIKGKLIIHKQYGNNNSFNPEPNISFNIYDQSNNLIQTIMTDKSGTAEITLPYGKYTLTQLTTTEGYQKVEPITFEITTNNQVIEKTLKNYKIEVPNTSKKSLLELIIEFIKEILC